MPVRAEEALANQGPCLSSTPPSPHHRHPTLYVTRTPVVRSLLAPRSLLRHLCSEGLSPPPRVPKAHIPQLQASHRPDWLSVPRKHSQTNQMKGYHFHLIPLCLNMKLLKLLCLFHPPPPPAQGPEAFSPPWAFRFAHPFGFSSCLSAHCPLSQPVEPLRAFLTSPIRQWLP